MKHNLFRYRAVAALLALLTLLLSATACGNEEAEARIRAHCETVLDGLIANDRNAAFAVLANVSQEDLHAFADEVMPLLQDVTSYELKQNGWHFRTENGITQHTMTYRMRCNNGAEYQVEATETEGTEGLTGFYLHIPETAGNNEAPLLLRLLFGAVSLAAIAFCIWMVVDCARRKLRYKALWIVLIFVSVIFTLTIGGGNFNFNTTLGLILSSSSLYTTSVSHALSLKLSLPIGAILYAVLRQRLTVTEPPAPEEDPAEEEQK